MAFPATDLPDPATWFTNVTITSALMKSNIIDPINLLPRGNLGSASSTSNVTFSTTSAFAGLATLTITLAQQRRVKISVQNRFNPVSGVASRMAIQAGYNSGSSAVIGSFVGVGQEADLSLGTSTQASQSAFGGVLLAAGTYTFYASIQRVVGGGATDTSNLHYLVVEDIGAS